MMMKRPSEGFRGSFFKAALAALVLVLVVAIVLHAGSFLRSAVLNLTAPKSTDAELALLSKDALIARVQNDEKTLLQVKYQSVLYGLLSEENTKLRELVHAGSPSPGMTARVLSRPPQTAYDALIIDQGAEDGITPGDMVIFNGAALGKIVSADTGTSVVQLFSSAGTETDALLGNPPALSVAKGLGGGAFELSVPNGVAVAVGDAVRFQGSSSLLLGTVGKVTAAPTGAAEEISFHAPFSLADLDFVTVQK